MIKAVRRPAHRAQRLRAVAATHTGNGCPFAPLQLQRRALVVDLAALGQVLDEAAGVLHVLHRDGLLADRARALSPRPIPRSIRPPEISCNVAIALAVTVMSRVAGFVTQGPRRTRSCSPRPTRTSCRTPATARVNPTTHTASNPCASASLAHSIVLETGGSSMNVTPKESTRSSPSSLCVLVSGRDWPVVGSRAS